MKTIRTNRNGDVLTIDSGVSQPTEDVCFGYYLLRGLGADENDILNKEDSSRGAGYGILDHKAEVEAKKDDFFQLYIHFWSAVNQKACEPYKLRINTQFLRVAFLAPQRTCFHFDEAKICAIRWIG